MGGAGAFASHSAAKPVLLDSGDDSSSSSSSTSMTPPPPPPLVVRPEEIAIVVLVLILWAAAIALFINRWGKIRLMEPYQVRKNLPFRLNNFLKIFSLPLTALL